MRNKKAIETMLAVLGQRDMGAARAEMAAALGIEISAIRETPIYDGESWTEYALPSPQAARRLSPRRFALLSRCMAVAISPSAAKAYGSSIKPRRREQEPEKPVPFFERLRTFELVPSAYKYKRAVGVEIEGLLPRSSRATLGAALPYYARAVNDASISGNGEPCEVRILLNRAAIEPRLQRVLGVMHAHGFAVNRSCGLHVHLHAAHLTMEQRRAKQKIVMAWLRLLASLVPPSRRQNNYCMLDLTGASAARSRYAACSIATGHKNTLEIRLHSATTDFTKIMMWIRLCELLFVMTPPRRGLQPGLAALEALPLCDWDKSYWVQRHADLNPRADLHGSTTEEGE